jgi:flagellar biogenesis protein FliO
MTTALTFLIIVAILTAGLACVHWLKRRLQRPTTRGNDLILEQALPLGPQKRLLSVTWKGTELLIAESPAGIELLTSNMLQQLSAGRRTAKKEYGDDSLEQAAAGSANSDKFSMWIERPPGSPLKREPADSEESPFHA